MAPEDRREAILTATVPLLLANGLAVTTRQIAEAAGVAEGTLFRVFDDKRALIVAALAQAFDPENMVAGLREVDTGQDLESLLHDMVEVLRRRAGDARAVMAIGFEMRRAAGPLADPDPDDVNRPGSIAHAVAQWRERSHAAPEVVTAVLSGLLAPHADELRRPPAVCARFLLSLVTSAGHSSLDPLDQLTSREVVEILLDGVRARPASTPTSESSC